MKDPPAGALAAIGLTILFAGTVATCELERRNGTEAMVRAIDSLTDEMGSRHFILERLQSCENATQANASDLMDVDSRIGDLLSDVDRALCAAWVADTRSGSKALPRGADIPARKACETIFAPAEKL